MEGLKSGMTTLKTELQSVKQDIKDTIANSIRQAVADCFESNFTRLAAMMDMCKVIEEPCKTGQTAEEHVLINDAEDLTKFNVLLANADVRKQYVRIFCN